MKHLYSSIVAIILATILSPLHAIDTSKADAVYSGDLAVTLFGETFPSKATIYIENTSDTKCTIMLPDFSFDLQGEGEPTNLGDIVVPDVEYKTTEGVTTYAGEVKDMKLNDELKADVALEGTATGDELDMAIHVKWMGIPIEVTFKGKKTAGIGHLTIDAEAPAEYYDLNGVRVDPQELVPGIYIVRQGGKSLKIRL